MPFKPIRGITLSTAIQKVVLLVAITFAKQVSDLVALSYKYIFLVLHKEGWGPELPKAVSALHLK